MWCRPCESWQTCTPQRHQNEVRTITAIQLVPNPPAPGDPYYALQLDAPLTHAHYAGVEYQAEVALLSRRINLIGSPTSDTFGAHVKVQGAGTGRFSGVRAERMGQMNVVGRYPFHLHMLGDTPNSANSFIQDCSVTNSFFRAYVVHGTNAVRLLLCCAAAPLRSAEAVQAGAQHPSAHTHAAAAVIRSFMHAFIHACLWFCVVPCG